MIKLMREYTYENLDGRNALIDKLVNEYTTATAAEATVVIGNHGCGKSYALYEVINKIQSMNDYQDKIHVYIAEGEKLVLYGSASKFSADNVEASISLPLRWGCGMNIALSGSSKSSESQFNHICNLLKKHFSTNILICLPKYSEQHSKVKLLTHLLVTNLPRLKKAFKHKIFFLISDLEDSCINDFLECTSINKMILKDYEETDIIQYLNEKHSLVLNHTEIREKLSQIKKICASNLKLIDFLYVDFVEQSLDFFRALDSVVTYRLSQLKRDGLQRNVSEYDMEDIILTSSISLKSFSSHEIAMVTHKQIESVREGLNLAQNQIILHRNALSLYTFICDEIQQIFQTELNKKNRERYLDYYNYYCEHEQDQYYLRAYYLLMYLGHISNEVFALLMLSYSEAVNFSNVAQKEKIASLIYKDESTTFHNDFAMIESFYKLLDLNSTAYDNLRSVYNKIIQDYYELPLKAELARAFFHFAYRNYEPWNPSIKRTLHYLCQCAEESLHLSLSQYPLNIKRIDETVVRLRIIYDISPYILDVFNDIDLFTRMYDLSNILRRETSVSQAGKSIAQYMENVYNRKAFLFVNQTQCYIYYEKAKKYFYDNEIWDEYCITLICEAGTNIVIQKYEEAIELCRKAKQFSSSNNILIPYPQKMKNNTIIASFFQYEQTHQKKQCFIYAHKAARKLQKNLQKIPCATEFVIITNICSLYLYSGDVTNYSKYKKYLERLMCAKDVADINDEDIDDFYRYYFAWFEVYKCISENNWSQALQIAKNLEGFIPSLFKKQEIFWDKKLLALNKIISNRKSIDGYEFCRNLVPLHRRASELAAFFCRGLMLSDLQYTSYD